MAELSAVAVLVLGLLHEQPMHPYQLHQTLVERGDTRIVRVNPGAVYHGVERLERDGLVEVVGTDRTGKRPERTTYRITDAGRAEFATRLTSLLGDEHPAYPLFSVGLAEANELPGRRGRRAAGPATRPQGRPPGPARRVLRLAEPAGPAPAVPPRRRARPGHPARRDRLARPHHHRAAVRRPRLDQPDPRLVPRCKTRTARAARSPPEGHLMSSEQPRALVDLHGRSPWSILPALCLGFFMIMVDTTIVNIAIPSLVTAFDADLTAVGWVNSAYLLTFATLLLVDRPPGRPVRAAARLRPRARHLHASRRCSAACRGRSRCSSSPARSRASAPR